MSIFKPIRKFRKHLKIKLNGIFGPLPEPEKWVFIVGCGNSGTTLLQRMLSSHPAIGSMLWEGQFFHDQLKGYKWGGWYKRRWATVPEYYRMDENSTHKVNVERLKRQWGAKFNDPTKPVLLEKSPRNTLRVRWLQKHFENAYFIGMMRNGYAVAEGIRRRVKRYDLRTAALQWTKANEFMLDDFNHLERKKIIRYETLAEKPDECLREICEFIGIDPKGMSLGGKVWSIHKEASTIKNMNYKSFEKLSEEDCQIIEEIAGDMLKRLNYSRQERS
jgi:hypothetical protein